MDYNFREIEQKWQNYWKQNKTFKVTHTSEKPKFYVLDMFPYPSGAGLHVGHPLGYIASDIYTRYKNLKGYNVLHPMGFDAFGLPAEQYAIQTGQHPAVTTEKNILRYKEQLEKIGFAFDWDREIRTSDPAYYKWTQWVFIKLFKHWYNNETKKAEPVENLIQIFENFGNKTVNSANNCKIIFTADDWKQKNEKEKQEILLCYRLAYLAETMVNWCPALGTVLANDEVKEGLSVRGGYPVEQRKMKQWCLRITAYAERLLNGLDNIDWTDSLKEIQRNWIGKSAGAEIKFTINNQQSTIHNQQLNVFTTRPDTIFGCTFMVLAPEHELVYEITTPEQMPIVKAYIAQTKKRTERERITEVNKITGCFTGAYAKHPFTGLSIPVWLSDYVLSGYGTGAIMAVPAHDSRDFAFARHFNLPIVQVIKKTGEEPTDTSLWIESFDAQEGTCINSDFINGMDVNEGIKTVISKIEEKGIGKRMLNYRLRDAIFSRQRYWGEPFPVYFKDEIPYPLPEAQLPLELPQIDSFLPATEGQPPLGRITNWKTKEGYPLELSTMPGFAGSSGYYLRYMDPTNNNEFVSKDANKYWENVDMYIGGTEHATGHLIYSRFWNKFLFDIEYVCKDEPFKKLINQGMILGVSEYVCSITPYILEKNTPNFHEKIPITIMYDYIWCGEIIHLELGDESKEQNNTEVYYSADIADIAMQNIIQFEEKNPIKSRSKMIKFPIPVSITKDHTIIEPYRFKEWRGTSSPDKTVLVCKEGYWLLKGYGKSITHYWIPVLNKTKTPGSFYTIPVVEKMSKSRFNVVNPDSIIEKYGADTLRMYEMFLGPLEQSKPWDTSGIEGVHRFLKKLWKLYHDENNSFKVSEEQPSAQELKALHKLINKVQQDIEQFSFNTSVSAFMICVNQLTALKCNKRNILETLTIILSPFVPHIAEELWRLLGHHNSIVKATYPAFEEAYIKENTMIYPVSFNGKVRFQIELALTLPVAEIEKAAIENKQTSKWLNGKIPKKIIVVPGKIINVVF